MTRLEINEKYAPLANLKTRYAVITGGRGSGKSFAIATLLIAKTEQYQGKTILFTRYTLTNAETSIMPEFLDKIDRGNLQRRFHKSGNEIVNTRTGTRILCRGIKTSSGINTAALKSIPNLVLWINDESEELVDETIFDTIDNSIRDLGSHCEVWLVLNPPDIGHFIYKKFYAGYGLTEVANTSNEDVTYIHTTYKDNAANLDPDYIHKADKLALTNPAKYEHIWLGHWARNKEGLIYKGWVRIDESEWPSELPQWYANDWGYSDWPNASVRMAYDPARGILYIREVKPLSDPSEARLTRGAAKAIIKDAEAIGMQPYECEVYCDPARPENIKEMRTIYDLTAVKAINRDKVGRIHYLQGFQVRYIGDNIQREVEVYSWQRDPHNRELFIDKPVDGNDHFMDSISYGCSKLRKMGVNGEEEA